jgi:hypothetical protein
MTHKHPILIFVRGLPGSGKSYLALELQKAIGEDKVVMLDPDATDYKSREYLEHVKAQTAEGVDPALHPYRFLRAQAYQGIADHKVIMWNQPFTNLEIFNKMIDRLRTHAAEHKTELPILVVEVEVDPATAKERVAKRKQAGGHGPSDATFARRVGDYTSLVAHGYNVVVVHGEDDVAASVATVMAALQELQK